MKTIRHLLPVLGFAVLTAVYAGGCGERAADLENLQTYKKHNVSFAYPGNWKISDEFDGPGGHQVQIESPGSAVAMVHIQPSADMLRIDRLADHFHKVFTETLPDAMLKDRKLSAVRRDKNGETLVEHFTMTVMDIDMPHTRRYHSIVSGDRSCALIFQSADEDLDKTDPGFNRILSTFRFD